MMGKGEIARYEQFLLFPQCFLKALKAYNIKGLFGKSYTIKDLNFDIEATGQNNITHTPFTIFTTDVLKARSIPYLGEKTEH